MPIRGPAPIQCPNCGQSLPPSATSCQFCGAALTGKAAQQNIRTQIKGPMTAGAATMYKVAGAFWLIIVGWDIFRFVLTPHQDVIVPATRQHPAAIFHPWTIYAGLSLVWIFMGAIALGMILDWDWVRPWAKFLAWFGLVTSVCCCLPSALVTAGSIDSWQNVAIRTVAVLIMSIVTLWSLKETA